MNDEILKFPRLEVIPYPGPGTHVDAGRDVTSAGYPVRYPVFHAHILPGLGLGGRHDDEEVGSGLLCLVLVGLLKCSTAYLQPHA